VTDEERADRAIIRDALTELIEFNETGKAMSRGLGGLIGCAYAAMKGGTIPDGEELGGAIVCMIGVRGSQTTEMVGAFNPILAYGALIDAMFEVRTASEIEATQATIKSFVGDAQAALADIEKQVTHPTDH
jgi:hypothetical protein